MFTMIAKELQRRAGLRHVRRVTGSLGFAFTAATGVALSACGGGGGSDVIAPLVVGTLTIAPTAPTVVETRTTKLSAVVKSTTGQVLTDRVVKWTSGSITIATVNDSGLVTGVTPGTAIVTATSEGVSANVTINVTLSPCNTSVATPIVANIPVAGTLATTDCDFGDGTFLDAYNFSLTSATTVDVLLKSTAFDSYLFVYSLTASGLTKIGEDDDSGGGNDARLTGSLGAGNYYILANSINVGGAGAYTLLLTSPYSALSAPTSLFNSSTNAAITLRRVNANEARLLRGLTRQK